MTQANPTVPVHVPIGERINFRIVFFALFVLALIGFPAYWYFDSVFTKGIKQLDDGYLEVDLKAMSSFRFDQDSGTIEDVPAKWRDLDRKKVVLTGEMWAPFSSGDTVDEFDLVYSVSACCFSGPPQIQHFVKARKLPGAESIPVMDGVVVVRGRLYVDVRKGDDGKIASVYQLDVESVHQK
jgi:hypothetical protein